MLQGGYIVIEKEFTTTEIGKLAGVTRKTVGKYIKGKGIEPVEKQGNIPKYSEKVKNEIVEHYKKLNHENVSASKDNGCEEIIKAKDELIAELRREVEVLTNQLNTVNTLVDQAQKLNLLDKNTKELEEPKKKKTWKEN